MGFEWQFGTPSAAGRPLAHRKGGVKNIDGATVACKSARGKWRESASIGVGRFIPWLGVTASKFYETGGSGTGASTSTRLGSP